MEPLTVSSADRHAPLVRVSPGQLGDVLGGQTTFLLSTPETGAELGSGQVLAG